MIGTNLAMEKDTTSKLCAEHLSISTFVDNIQSNDIYTDKEIWTHHKPSVRMYGDLSNNNPPLSPQARLQTTHFTDALSQSQMKKWYEAGRLSTVSDKQAYCYSWVDQANQSNMLTDWSFGLVPIPTGARHNEQLRKNIFAIRARAAQAVQDEVQDFLRCDSKELEEKRDAILAEIDPLFTKEQYDESLICRDEHSDKHLEVLTSSLSYRREMLILNQPTENEGMTMRPDKRVYPQNVKKSVPSGKTKEATPVQFETPLSDYSDDDDNDRRYKSVRNSEIKKKNTSTRGKPQEATPGLSREQSGSKDPRHGVDDYSQSETPTRKRQCTDESGDGEWEYASRRGYRGRWNRPSRPRARAIHTPRGGYSHGEALDTAKHE